jgi:hypothetical protein
MNNSLYITSSHLPDSLERCDLDGSDITHVVLNLTSNWLTEFDVDKLIEEEIYKKLIGELVGIFKDHNIKKAVVLTFPYVSF